MFPMVTRVMDYGQQTIRVTRYISQSFMITLSHANCLPVTIQFPYEKLITSERFRGPYSPPCSFLNQFSGSKELSQSIVTKISPKSYIDTSFQTTIQTLNSYHATWRIALFPSNFGLNLLIKLLSSFVALSILTNTTLIISLLLKKDHKIGLLR